MTPPTAEAPVFISYSRHDYYFAESLALHLLKENVPAWLDVKDLHPGVFWERDLFGALESSSCVVIVASRDSMKSPNVRQEMERAISLKKRIIIARFRGAKLVPEIYQCEVVDFRGAFGPALKKLSERLKSGPVASPAQQPQRMWPKAPPWVLATVFLLTVPTIAYLSLSDLRGDPSPLLMEIATVLFAIAFLGWAMSVSFVQRKMGMTRLALSLTMLGAVFVFPVVNYLRHGAAGLRGESSGFAQATVHHWRAISLLAALPLLGIAIILLTRPYDLLRWTPTGKAWHWYRRHCATKVFRGVNLIAAPQPKAFFLLHDTADAPAGDRVRESLTKVGWTESKTPASAASVLLLSNRTGTNWLLEQQAQLTPDVLTVVATTICLPAQLEWLWKREWVDLRSWKIERLHSQSALPQVPEAVTTPHFPGPVKFANHLLCCLAGLAFVLLSVSDPALTQSQTKSEAPIGQQLLAMAGVAMILLCTEMARRLLRRSITEAKFYRWSWIGYFLVVVLAGCAWSQGFPPPAWLRSLPVVAFLVAFPILLLRTKKPLAFWFPATAPTSSLKVGTLTGKRYWRTLWCTSAYLLAWGWIAGMMNQ